MKAFIACLFFVFISLIIKASDEDRIKVGIFWDNQPKSVILTLDSGHYMLKGDGKLITDLAERDMYQVSVVGKKIQLKTLTKIIGTYKNMELLEVDSNSSFNIKSNKPKLLNRVYQDDLYISVYHNKLKLVNHADFNNYLAGVVQSESGNKRTEEYYKVQAIICRTYALKHINKFSQYGFNLCDRVDSQVYKSKCIDNDTIRWAVEKTQDIVLVDDQVNLISALFHSNSGGMTLNSEDVWSKPLPYLRSVKDSFSFYQPHYEWEVTFKKDFYLSYFKRNYGANIKNKKQRKALVNYCPVARDIHFYQVKGKAIPLTRIRKDFKLKSTFFCVVDQGNNIKISGKGYGHGVGLAQEGAMKMAKNGYSYSEILHHYYSGIHLVKLSVMDLLHTDLEE